MKWQLGLEWKKESKWNSSNRTHENWIHLVPFIKMVPNYNVREKLGDVWIVAGNVTLDNDGSEKLVSLSPGEPIVLRKTQFYECKLTSEESPITTLDIDDSLTVEVDIYLIKNTLEVIEPVVVPECSVLQDFSKLQAFSEEESKEKFCDVKITCKATAITDESEVEDADEDATDRDQDEDQNGGEDAELGEVVSVFYAHKAILAVRSAVFARMFTNDMKESATNTIDLPDIESDTLNELMTYIYTNKCPNIKAQAEFLLYQAEKYELSHLKALCEERLSYDLQIANAARFLLLADRYNAEQLKRNAVLFINKHGKRVQLTKEWKEVQENNDLLLELLTTVYEPSAKKRRIQ